jgi:hypothetical protein
LISAALGLLLGLLLLIVAFVASLMQDPYSVLIRWPESAEAICPENPRSSLRECVVGVDVTGRVGEQVKDRVHATQPVVGEAGTRHEVLMYVDMFGSRYERVYEVLIPPCVVGSDVSGDAIPWSVIESKFVRSLASGPFIWSHPDADAYADGNGDVVAIGLVSANEKLVIDGPAIYKYDGRCRRYAFVRRLLPGSPQGWMLVEHLQEESTPLATPDGIGK